MRKERSSRASCFPHDSAASLFLLTLSSCAFSCWFRCRRRAFACDTLGAQEANRGVSLAPTLLFLPAVFSFPSFLSFLFVAVLNRLMLACFNDM